MRRATVKILSLLLFCCFLASILVGCGNKSNATPWRKSATVSSAPDSVTSHAPTLSASAALKATEKPTLTPAPTPLTLSGKCGDSLSWTLTETGELTISGSGPMYDYSFNWDYGALVGNDELTMEDVKKKEAPWKYAVWKEEETGGKSITIKNATIEDGVTSIGAGAFFGIRSIDKIVLPESVTAIGTQAFGCMDLKEIVLPAGLTSLAKDTFSGGEPKSICFNGTWTQWKALTGAPPADHVEIAVDDRPDDETLLKGLVDSGEYAEYVTDWTSQPTRYAIIDIGGDGRKELLLSTETDSIGFSTWGLLSVNSETGEIQPVHFLNMNMPDEPFASCHNDLRFSEENHALVFKSTNNGSMFGSFGYWIIEDERLVLMQTLNYDTTVGSGQTTFTLSKDEQLQNITEEEYKEILGEAKFIEFMSLSS